MIVIFDTNIWKSNLYLKSPVAASVRAYLKINDATIGLPEVIELEIKKHLEQDIEACSNSIYDNFQRLLAWFGELKEIVLPSKEEAEELISRYLDFTGLDVTKIPFDEEAARLSFLRTIDKRRPSHKNQQFKDGVIWEVCKRLAAESEVILVTADKAFYQDDVIKNGLADELRSELNGHRFSIVDSLPSLLDSIKRPIVVDNDLLKSCVDQQIGDQIRSLADRNGFYLGESEYDVKFFATEDEKHLFVDIEAIIEVLPKEELDAVDAKIILHCDGTHNVIDGTYVGLSPLSMRLEYIDRDGELIEKRNVFIRADGMVLGHRTVRHMVRNELV